MGEVRIPVKLTNAVDEGLRRRKKLSAKNVRSLRSEALVDTVAMRTIIPAQVARQLGLAIHGKQIAEYADGRKETVAVTEPLWVNIAGRDTTDEALVLGNEILLGQTVLEKLDLLVDCANQRVIPNPVHSEGPVAKVK